MASSQQIIASQFGKYNKDISSDGSHYIADNIFARDGIKCDNCVFFLMPDRCGIVKGEILPQAVCKLWVIPDEKLNPVFVALRQLDKLQDV